MQTELEKTQLEIAKRQLEQERHKLAQMQRRQGVVDGLGQGAVAVGGATRSGLLWAAYVALGAVLGGAAGGIGSVVWMLITKGAVCRAAPNADFLYRVGCATGENSVVLLLSIALGLASGAYGGHAVYRETRSR